MDARPVPRRDALANAPAPRRRSAARSVRRSVRPRLASCAVAQLRGEAFERRARVGDDAERDRARHADVARVHVDLDDAGSPPGRPSTCRRARRGCRRASRPRASRRPCDAARRPPGSATGSTADARAASRCGPRATGSPGSRAARRARSAPRWPRRGPRRCRRRSPASCALASSCAAASSCASDACGGPARPRLVREDRRRRRIALRVQGRARAPRGAPARDGRRTSRGTPCAPVRGCASTRTPARSTSPRA